MGPFTMMLPLKALSFQLPIPHQPRIKPWRWTMRPPTLAYYRGCPQVGRWRWSQVWPTSRSPLQEARMRRVRKPPIRRHSPSHTMLMGRHFLWVPPELHRERREATLPDKEGSVELTPGDDSRATLLQGFFSKNCTLKLNLIKKIISHNIIRM